MLLRHEMWITEASFSSWTVIYWLLWKKPGKEQMWAAASPQPLWAPALWAFSVPVLFHTGRISLCSPGWLKFTAISSQPPECWEADVCHHTQLTLYSFLLGLWICSSISLSPGALRLKSAHGKNLLASWSHRAFKSDSLYCSSLWIVPFTGVHSHNGLHATIHLSD